MGFFFFFWWGGTTRPTIYPEPLSLFWPPPGHSRKQLLLRIKEIILEGLCRSLEMGLGQSKKASWRRCMHTHMLDLGSMCA